MPRCRKGAHPKTPENTGSRGRCKECRRIREEAQAEEARRAAGKQKRGDPERYPCGHPRTPENTRSGEKGGCRECSLTRKRDAYVARLAAEGKTRVVVTPGWFPCGHSRTPENTNAQRRCKECARIKARARHHAEVAAQGRELWRMDPDWFPCGHPRVAGNLTPRQQCRVCHIDRAAKSYRENGKSSKGSREKLRERLRIQKQCLREERADPATADYVRIIKQDPCSYCGGPGGTRDHVIPTAAGGPNRWENYTGACLSCNVGKNDKPLLTYLLDRIELAEARAAKTA